MDCIRELIDGWMYRIEGRKKEEKEERRKLDTETDKETKSVAGGIERKQTRK